MKTGDLDRFPWLRRGTGSWISAGLVLGLALGGCTSLYRQQQSQLLLEAVLEEAIDRASSLIDSGADVNAPLDQDRKAPNGTLAPAGHTPLRIAIDRKNLGLVQMLLDRGADPNLADAMGWTPLEGFLQASPQSGPEKIALLLIDYGAKVNTEGGFWGCIVGEDPGRPLHVASGINVLRVAQAMITHGAEVNARSFHGRTPLHFANTPEMIALLKKAGGDLEAGDKEGLTPLGLAVVRNWPQKALALLQAGAKPVIGTQNSFMPSLLHHVIFGTLLEEGPSDARIALAKALVEKGVDLDLPNEFQETPLLFASGRSGETEEKLALLILAGGANPKLRNQSGDTALHCAIDRRHPRLVRELLRKGVEVSARNDFGDTPLHQACFVYEQDPQYILALVAAGADVHAKNDRGQEPLDLADEKERETIALLLKVK